MAVPISWCGSWRERPDSRRQLGSYAAVWDDILPRVPESIWWETLTELARRLALGGGERHV
jgi:hypothetical protein